MPARPQSTVPPPRVRPLRVFAFDPSFAWQPELALLNETVLEVPWEDLAPGPVGEYLEVIDVDPASGCCYEPVDLDHPHLLAQSGLPPSEASPQFHQQMVYAVAMRTIASFERALGRRVLWADGGPVGERRWVRRLRILPHGMRWQNACYDPAKKALVFGYFPAATPPVGCGPSGGTVFTCLAHDVVVHETSHALLDGLHRRYEERSNPDSLALHEAFADLVALLQRLSNAEALAQQIAATRGDLADHNVLAGIAYQWGMASGHRGPLRDALGRFDAASGSWRPRVPRRDDLANAREEHERGAVLVAALFDAFVSLYKARVADLFRLAEVRAARARGALHPTLVGRLAREAAKVARHVLTLCIRALDYCPPVDVDFGDYLRALVTADRDLVPRDERRYRLAVIEACRRRGIYPRGLSSLAEASLAWQPPPTADQRELDALVASALELRGVDPALDLEGDRRAAWWAMRRGAARLHATIATRAGAGELRPGALGLALDPARAPHSIVRDGSGLPIFEVHSVRPARRLGPDGEVRSEIVIEITQQRLGFVDAAVQREADAGGTPPYERDFVLRGGATLLVDLESGRVRYALVKRVDDPLRLNTLRRYLCGDDPSGLCPPSMRT